MPHFAHSAGMTLSRHVDPAVIASRRARPLLVVATPAQQSGVDVEALVRLLLMGIGAVIAREAERALRRDPSKLVEVDLPLRRAAARVRAVSVPTAVAAVGVVVAPRPA